MGMKGISPVIAAVILIAISIAVGVMLSSWVTHWVSTRTSQASSACVTSTNYNIDSAKFKTSNKNLSITITNLGNTKLYGFSVQVLNETDVMSFNSSDPNFYISPNITESKPLAEQETAIIIIHMEGRNYTLGYTAQEIRVLNKACPTFSAETTNIIKE
ncbi:MAG: hypothetical protein J7K72_02535 [Candidatus Aenigmarchaeota archaeon]|nr:hypothetical protein [Candidatus Aenigmarchaeota archaeon]